MNVKKVIFPLLIVCCFSVVMAQDYYDDDIYYDAAKAKKEKTSNVKQNNSSVKQTNKSTNYSSNGYGSYDYPAADTYYFSSSSTRDVDEYNRRGDYGYSDSLAVDSISVEDFAYTRRIEKFYNPTIVSGSGDNELQEYYYGSREEPSEINIYVNTPYWYSWGPYRSSWYWTWSSPWYYDPWYSWYGPSWYYDPYWNWAGYWGPSWYPGYYPGHHHHPPHFAGPGTHRPASSGAYRPVRPSQSRGGYATTRPGTVNNRNGVYGGGASRNNRSNALSGHRSSSNNNNGYSRQSNSNRSRDSYSRPSNNNNSRSNSFSRPSSGSRSSGFSGGGRGGGSRGGGRGGRH